MAESEYIDWDSLMKIFTTDGRIANSHLEIPGHDGQRGFGGKCFPANLDEMLRWMSEKDYDSEMIKAIKKKGSNA